MRILFIHNTYQLRGGEDVALESEISLLLGNGHEVEVLVFNNQDISGVWAKVSLGIKAVYNKASATVLKQKIEAFSPDVIHIHNLFFIASPSILYMANKKKIPVVLTMHNYRLVCANAMLLRNNTVCELCLSKTLPFEAIKYKCYRNSSAETALVVGITGLYKLNHAWRNKVDTYIALTEFSKNKILNSSTGINPEQIKVVPNFVHDMGYAAFPRENFFLFVGRLSKEKGLHIAIEAFKNLPHQQLLVVGDGPEKDYLQQQAAGSPNIFFAGGMKKSEVIDTMKRCKALIFPSIWYEGLPFTIIEAFSTGTPVIASRLGSMTEIITDAFNGNLFEAGNPTQLQTTITRFIENAKEPIYKNARKTYEEKYHPDMHYNALMEIYHSILHSKHNVV